MRNFLSWEYLMWICRHWQVGLAIKTEYQLVFKTRFFREKQILRSLKLTTLLTSFSLRTGVAPFCIFIFCLTVWFWIYHSFIILPLLTRLKKNLFKGARDLLVFMIFSWDKVRFEKQILQLLHYLQRKIILPGETSWSTQMFVMIHLRQPLAQFGYSCKPKCSHV